MTTNRSSQPTVGDEVTIYSEDRVVARGELVWISANQSKGWRCAVHDEDGSTRNFGVEFWSQNPWPLTSWQGQVL